ncbi:MAG: TolC family protein [Spirochaetales bacterium]|nr:TolC family protein [Spirochaetales bacterium]
MNLEKAVAIAAANHFALKATNSRQAIVKKVITERWRSYLPRFGLSYNRVKQVNIGEVDNISHEIRLNIEQVIYDGGDRSLALDLARIDAMLASEDFRLIYNRLRLDVQQAYLSALSAAGKISLNKKSLERAALQLRFARLEHTQGISARAQLLTVAARLREVEQAVITAEAEYAQAKFRLLSVLNLDYGVELDLEGNLFCDFYMLPPEVDEEKLVYGARSKRVEIKRSQTNLHRLKKEKEIIENAWIPRVSLGGYVGRAGDRLPVRDRTWGIDIAVTFPIAGSSASSGSNTGIAGGTDRRSAGSTSGIQVLDQLSYYREKLESQVSLGQAINEHDRLYNQIAIEVKSGIDSLHQSWESIRTGNGRTFFRYEALRLTQTGFRVGTISRADLVFAETELVQAQESLTDAIAGYILAAYGLESSAGLDPGALRLSEYSPDAGNTLLCQMLRQQRSDRVKRIDARKLPGPAPRRGYLIDEVELE